MAPNESDRTPQCFVIMPITTPPHLLAEYGGDAAHFENVYEHLFRPSIASAGFEPIPPAAKGADLIHAEIIRNLERADLVLCDMSALNANVFFELGIRTALNKPVCMVKDDTTSHTPFDASITNYHTYASKPLWSIKEQRDLLVRHIEESRDRSGGVNALWKHFGISGRANLTKESSGTEAVLELVSVQLDALNQKIDALSPVAGGHVEQPKDLAPTFLSVARALGVGPCSIAASRTGLEFSAEGATDESLYVLATLAESLKVPLQISTTGSLGQTRYQVTFTADSAPGRIGALQFVVEYNPRRGRFVGERGSVPTLRKMDGMLSAFNHDTQQNSLTVGFISTNGFTAPNELAAVHYLGSASADGKDFRVTTQKASDPNGKPIDVRISVALTPLTPER